MASTHTNTPAKVCSRIFTCRMSWFLITLYLDTSPLSNWVMHPFWNATVKLFPRWVAPNLLTLLGFLFLVSQTILLWIIDPDYKKGGQIDEIPKWVS